MATEPAKRRTSKSKPDQSASAALPETAMPPPTLTHYTAPEVASAPPATDTSAAAQEAAPQPSPDPVREQRQSIFLPLVLGGLIAGGIGYGVAYTQFGQTPDVDLSGLQNQLDGLQDRVANLPPPVETGGLTQGLQDLGARVDDLDARVSDLDARLGNMDTRVGDLNDQVDARIAELSDQVAQASQQAPVIGDQARQDAVAELSAEISAQQSELDQQRAALEQQLDAARTEADRIQQEALATARSETARAALARVQGAVESGAPMQPALDDLGSALSDPVPDALTAVADGAPTLSSLRDAFPDAARAALTAARAAGESGDSAGALGTFMRNQLNVRSTAPRSGDSVDATLSRAEDALRAGRLSDAVTETDALPASARDAMSDWVSQAKARVAAVDAADQLDDSLSAN